jgi:hypothetical protein
VFAGTDSKLAFYVNGDRSPNNLYVLELGSGKATRLTDSLIPDINPQDHVDTQTVRFQARPDDHPHDDFAASAAALRHRLRDLVLNTGDMTIATDRGVPRSTARGWRRRHRGSR